MPLDQSLAELARFGAPDRYFTALLAPRQARDGLIAHAAFLAEISQIPDKVREPMAGEIRLQWWRDVLTAGATAGVRCGHPTADAFASALAAAKVPLGLVISQIDAVGTLFDDAPFADMQALRNHWEQSETAAFLVAARLLGAHHDTAVETAATATGAAYGMARLLYDLPADYAKGRLLLPATVLAEAGLVVGEPVAEQPPLIRSALNNRLERLAQTAAEEAAAARQRAMKLPRQQRVGLLPLAMVPVYLSLIAGVTDRWHQQEPLMPLRRLWRLWRAHSFGQFS